MRPLGSGWPWLVALLGAVAALGVLARAPAWVSGPLGTAVTYQGQLKQGGSPVTGQCDFTFQLFDAASGGSQVGSTQSTPNIPVTGGLFTVVLDFGAGVFDGNERWLEVAVRCPSGSGSFTTLSPRQRLTAVPYALYARSGPYSAEVGLSLAGTQFSLLPSYQLPQSCGVNQLPRWTGSGWGCEYVWFWGGNAGTSAGTHFLGTTDAQALELKVQSQRALRLEPAGSPAGSSPNVVGGSVSNTVTSGVKGATIGGGGGTTNTCGLSGTEPCRNRVTDDYGVVGGGAGNRAGDDAGTTSDRSYATVGGGYGNTASGTAATVGGGHQNTASAEGATVGGGVGNASGLWSTVSGGRDNNATGLGYGTVGGGQGNTATGAAATVGGGAANVVTGAYATVAGGWGNHAAGDYSFVVGRRAKNLNCAHDGVFIFADSSHFDFPSIAANQFRVRATGGAQFVLAIDGSGNPTWTCSATNGVSWSCSSDRNAKENLVLADGRAVLAQLAELPIYYWNAKGADPAIRHIGPTAQDFAAAFRVGADETSIATIDLDGVALVAIQGLYQQQQELQQQNAVPAAGAGRAGG